MSDFGALKQGDAPYTTVDPAKHRNLKIVNCVCFVICMAFNGFAQKLAAKSLAEQTDYWNVANAPAGYAFSIWGVIYTLLAFFTVYQALPEKWAETRNNDLIVNKIGWVYAMNLMGNALWLVVFGQDAAWAFGLSLVVILGMLASQVYIMRCATRSKVNTWEFITLRCGFTIYTGWVTAATILNTTFFLKSLGMRDDGAGLAEDTWCVVILWIALCVYVLASFMERNPLYAAVYIWVLVAIRKNHDDPEDALKYSAKVVDQSLIIVIIHAIYVALLTGFCFYEKNKEKCKLGLLY